MFDGMYERSMGRAYRKGTKTPKRLPPNQTLSLWGMPIMCLIILTLPLDADGGGSFTTLGLVPYAGQAGVRPA